MKNKLVPTILAFGLLLGAAGSVSADGASVMRVENIDTVVAVRMAADFPLASLMRADCRSAEFVTRPDGSGVETLRCQLSDEPVMVPAFQGKPPSTAFVGAGGPCMWTSDFWFAHDGSIVLASSFHYVVTPSGRVNAVAYYPATPLGCE